MVSMGILDNLENAWDDDFLFESKTTVDKFSCTPGMPEYESNPMAEIDSMGREKFWQDLGRPEESNLLAQTTCSCSGCSCGK
jgi:hypothetical protein